MLLNGRVVTIAHTDTDEVIRIISVRKATKNEKSATSNRSRTDWRRVDRLRDEEIDFSDTPEITPEMFVRGVVRRGLKAIPHKEQLTLRIDSDVLEWFRKHGRGYQTRINALLRAYLEAHKN